MHVDQKNILLKLFQNAVEAVKGDKSVSTWLSHNELRRPTHMLAAGKAATAMVWSWFSLCSTIIGLWGFAFINLR